MTLLIEINYETYAKYFTENEFKQLLIELEHEIRVKDNFLHTNCYLDCKTDLRTNILIWEKESNIYKHIENEELSNFIDNFILSKRKAVNRVVEDIIYNHLKNNGYDGLCNSSCTLEYRGCSDRFYSCKKEAKAYCMAAYLNKCYKCKNSDNCIHKRGSYIYKTIKCFEDQEEKDKCST